ncbi:phospholipase A1-like isoform X2 [Euwallacea fornicatus]|uniref:phospholipase A1-like isoform X2 n=1 Tax=Euwallacea fornicatus TaxID=995702 RepID=UPI0033903AC3
MTISTAGTVIVTAQPKADTYSRGELQELYPGFGTDFIFFPDDENNPIIGYFKSNNVTRIFPLLDQAHLERDVKFEFFSRDFPDGVYIDSKPTLSKYVNISKPTKIITHGWMSGGRKDSCVLIRNGFLHRYDANILVMDWSAISGNPFYPLPMTSTPQVGQYYGSYLNYLVDKVGVKPEDLHLVGHSLGAHVSGFAGREVKKGKVARITGIKNYFNIKNYQQEPILGLDPALPGFDVGLLPSGTLNSNDASFVDIIHTCAGYLGFKSPLGHADFYPNGGGPPQPGCSILQFIEACSHGISWKIFASSLINEDLYMATKCATLNDIEKLGVCAGDPTPLGDPTPTTAKGIYYSRVLAENLIVNAEDKNKI